jgi:iron complex transport system ATP-binding protein
MLEGRNISVVRGRATLLDDVSVTVEPGKLTAIVGPNGAGKSTLLRVLAGEIRPTKGAVCLEGKDISTLPALAMASRRAVVPQTSLLSFPFTVIEVVMLGATVPGFELDDSKARAVALNVLEDVGLAGFADRTYDQLSGGERQRVHFARAVCQLAVAPAIDPRPLALLLDEPTASLDLTHQKSILRIVRQQANAGRAVLLIIHDLNLASAYADDIVVMSGGRIEAQGGPFDIMKDDLLSRVYGCALHVRRIDGISVPIVLPVDEDCRLSRGAAAE